jgi:shikimate dehydrogenase
MTIDGNLTAIQNCITNRLDQSDLAHDRIAGIIGDGPSRYSKSPALWNAGFAHLGIPAVYLPFDVDASRLRDLVSALRNCDRFMGMNVTVPHKVNIMEFLDELDPASRRIQAVNTVVRNPTGRLLGFNTDGEGFIQSISKPQPGQSQCFVASLKGLDVLLLGAGGSARAVAYHLSDHLEDGRLIISNRTMEHAVSLAAEIQQLGRHGLAIGEADVAAWAPKVGLIVNSTTKGQGGLRRLSSNEVTDLEPFSSLASASAPVLRSFSGSEAAVRQRCRELASAAIATNIKTSTEIAASVPKGVGFYDLIYHPEETLFLSHGRLTGHRTINGKAMIVNQAVIAFCQLICGADLKTRRIDIPETEKQLLEFMHHAW